MHFQGQRVGRRRRAVIRSTLTASCAAAAGVREGIAVVNCLPQPSDVSSLHTRIALQPQARIFPSRTAPAPLYSFIKPPRFQPARAPHRVTITLLLPKTVFVKKTFFDTEMPGGLCTKQTYNYICCFQAILAWKQPLKPACLSRVGSLKKNKSTNLLTDNFT